MHTCWDACSLIASALLLLALFFAELAAILFALFCGEGARYANPGEKAGETNHKEEAPRGQ